MKCVSLLLVVCICVGLSMIDARQFTRTMNGKGLTRAENAGKVLLKLLRSNEGHNTLKRVHEKKQASCGHTSTMSGSQENDAKDKHNALRKQEGSSNMLKMSYDGDLGNRAQEWADQCRWKHGLTEMCDGTGIGQNMYMTTGSLDVNSAIQGWYNEKSDYNYNANSCPQGVMCGHYTQVVWAESSSVGCGATQCPVVYFDDGTTWTNAVIFVCNYAPAGNYPTQPFLKGSMCSQCPWVANSGTKCDDGLCAACDVNSDSGCYCNYASSCNGHGTFESCGCRCDNGFYGDECENSCSCKDTPGYEDYACPAWQYLCPDPLYKDFLMGTCKKTCNFCDTPAGAC